MIGVVADVASWVLLVSGGLFIIFGGVGLLRLPDFYTRMHAASVTDSMGTGLVLAGLAIQGGFTLVTVKLILIFMFMFFTTPTATHALARTAQSAGVVPWRGENPKS